MSNSPLVNYTRISPNRTVNRNHSIDTITIHCVVGQCSVETLGSVFAPTSRKASSNYGIGKDGRIGMYVEEKDRSWCTSSASNDNRAITIECASDTKPPYAINAKVYAALVLLCADICLRNGIKELKWKNDKSLIGHIEKQNVTIHQWFANTACPGEYIHSRLGRIVEEVNSILRNKRSVPEEDLETFKPLKVRVDIDDLNIRTGPGTDYSKVGVYTGKGVFTIVEIRSGKGSYEGWGRLKSGAGWISLDFAKRIE